MTVRLTVWWFCNFIGRKFAVGTSQKFFLNLRQFSVVSELIYGLPQKNIFGSACRYFTEVKKELLRKNKNNFHRKLQKNFSESSKSNDAGFSGNSLKLSNMIPKNCPENYSIFSSKRKLYQKLIIILQKLVINFQKISSISPKVFQKVFQKFPSRPSSNPLKINKTTPKDRLQYPRKS